MLKRELELKLVKRFPTIFQDYGGDMRKTCMAWGFSHGDGWYDLLEEACLEIEKLCKDNGIRVVALQVKEKFGSLRFYYTVEYDTEKTDELGEVTKKIDEVISNAEEKSYTTCEICGKPGKTTGQFWIKTLCEECDKEKNDPPKGEFKDTAEMMFGKEDEVKDNTGP